MSPQRSLQLLPVRVLLVLASTAFVLATGALPAAALLDVSVVGSQTAVTVYPGGTVRKVFQVQLTNSNLLTVTLTSLSFTNATTGPGSQTQKDQEWQTLELRDSRIQFQPDPIEPGIEQISANQIPVEDPGGGGGGGPIATTTFVNGVARFVCSIGLPPGQTVTLNVWSSASLTARDADQLDLYIPNAAAVTVGGSVVSGSFRTLTVAVLIRATMSRGTPFGTIMPNQEETSYPFTPDSAIVGRSGAIAGRFEPVAPSAITLPDLMCGITAAMFANIACTCPPIRAGIAAPLPL